MIPDDLEHRKSEKREVNDDHAVSETKILKKKLQYKSSAAIFSCINMQTKNCTKSEKILFWFFYKIFRIGIKSSRNLK